MVFNVGAFSSNLRNEVARSKKYYFYDLGIRNGLVGQYHTLDSRSDIGALWENFLIVERLKKLEYAKDLVSHYFWRAYNKAEIDWIEQTSQGMQAFEFKWKEPQVYRTPKSFNEKYGLDASPISKENYLRFIL